MQKFLIVFGTRPEAIKMAPLVKELGKYSDLIKSEVCVTGQHREMLDSVLSIFGILPDYDLNIMKKGQDLYDITSAVLLGMRDVLRRAKPDLVFVHGDTTTSSVAALAAFYEKIPVAHVEAGLRTYDKMNPWPEEVNRQLTARLATYHFAPTQLAKQNLLNEGIDEGDIFITGNTVIDALLDISSRLDDEGGRELSLAVSGIKSIGYDCSRVIDQGRRMILITGHRRENFGDGFKNICNAIKTLSERYPDADFVYPMHLNPNVREPIMELFGNGKSENLFFIEPLDYLPFVLMMKLSFLIVTDSGGIQEEAPGLRKPVLVMRNTTERPEAVDAGTVKLVGTEQNKIVESVSSLMDDTNLYDRVAMAVNPYGDGHAAERILKYLLNI